MTRYRKKPVINEAIQWPGPGPGTHEVIEFCGIRIIDGEELANFVPLAYPAPILWVEANQTWLPIEPGEWIIRDSKGLYPCKPDVFAATYEPVEAPAGEPATVWEADQLLNSYGGVTAALRATHPDHGGDPEAFRRVQTARRIIREHEQTMNGR